jgi:hypothetical protein
VAAEQPWRTNPMLAILTDLRFSDPGWVFAPKFDGERCLAFHLPPLLRLADGRLLLASFSATMVAAGLLVELAFDAFGLVPQPRAAKVVEAAAWKYTAVLNLVFLAVSAVLVGRFLRTGGPAMLKTMGGPPAERGHGH